MSILLHGIGDFERISDHAINIVECAQEMHDKELEFSSKAISEIEVVTKAIKDIVNKPVDVFGYEDLDAAIHIEPLEQVIDGLTKKIKKNHIKRLTKGKCTIELGIILGDILTNLERVSDHCSNIAAEMLAINEDAYDTHELYNALSPERKLEFEEEYKRFKKMYILEKKDDKIKSSKVKTKDKKKDKE